MTKIVKAISLHQPWASLIPMGFKRYETRSWSTKYRGEILICAAKKQSSWQSETYIILRNFARQNDLQPQIHMPTWFTDLPFGQVVAIASLTNCIQISNHTTKGFPDMEILCGDWSDGRYAWEISNIRAVKTVPIKGMQGLWNVDLDSLTLDIVNPKGG